MVGTGELVFACLGIANHNALVGVLRVDTCTIGKRHDITFTIYTGLSSTFMVAGCTMPLSLWVCRSTLAATSLRLFLHRIVGSVLHSVHRCLGIDVVEHCVLLVFRRPGCWPRPRILHLGIRISASVPSVLTFLQCLLHTKNNGIDIGCVRIAFAPPYLTTGAIIVDGRCPASSSPWAAPPLGFVRGTGVSDSPPRLLARGRCACSVFL